MNVATLQMPSYTRTSYPVIEVESSDTVAQLSGHERSAGGHRRDHPPPSTGYRPRQPAPPSVPMQLTPSPLIRSASAPPDYVPSPSASRQHRATRSHWTTSPEEDFRVFQMPPEVVETGRRPKECSACCLRCIVVMTTLRWLFVSAALLGAGCVVTGIVFGVMSSTLNKNAFFILAFTFIGLGIVLVLVVGIGWRCSPAGHEPCHALCHLNETPSGGSTAYDTGTQRATRLMHRSRNQWYAGFLYPEFHYATPPPSYSISMQQYRQQVAGLQQGTADRERSIVGNSSISSLDNLSSLPSSPPPTYRSRIVGRVRPPLSGVMTLPSATSADLPPPYQNSSTASSLDRLADVEECEAPGSSEPVLATPDISESTDSDQRLVSDPSSQPQEGGVVVEPLATPTTHVINETTVAIIVSTPTVPDGTPEEVPSVRNIVKRFEHLTKETRTSEVLSETTGESSSANNQSLKTSSGNNQSNVRISVESSCSSTQSSNVQSDNDQSHLRISMSDVDSDSVNLVPDNPSTDNQLSQARSATTTKGHSQPAPVNNVTNNVHAASQSRSVSGQSLGSRQIQILPAANHIPGSSSSNPTFRAFSRSQSLDDPEIGESGI